MKSNGKTNRHNKNQVPTKQQHQYRQNNDQKSKEFECNSLNWDIKMCLKNKNIAQLFTEKTEEEVLQEMTKFISNQSKKETYISYQKDTPDAENLWYLWDKYPTQANIFFVYHLIGVCNPNIGLAIKSLKTNDSGWSKNIKGMEDSKRNWNFMNKLIWKTNSLATFSLMYKALIDNEVDPWALNVEQEDAFGSFIYKMFKTNKKGDPEQEEFFISMLTITSRVFIETKTQTILNKACQNYDIFESRLKYLFVSNQQVFFNMIAKKLASFKDLPRSCDKYPEITNLFQIIYRTLDNGFLLTMPKLTFGDLCSSYDDIIRKKIKKQTELKDIKYKAKNDPDRLNKPRLWDAFNKITEELADIKICWTDNVLYYFLTKQQSYPIADVSVRNMINAIQVRIDGITNDYVEGTTNPNLTSWSLESLVGFLAEIMAYNKFANEIVEFVQKIIVGNHNFSKLGIDIRFKIGLRFCTHYKNITNDHPVIILLNGIVSETTSAIYRFMLNDFLDGMKTVKIVKPNNVAKTNEIPNFDQLSFENLSTMDVKEFIDDITYDIELRFKDGFTEAQICHRYLLDVINLDSLIGSNERLVFKDGYKKHIKLLVLNEDINKLLPRNSLKKAQHKIRSEFKSVDGLNDVRYVINNIGRLLSDKINKNKKN